MTTTFAMTRNQILHKAFRKAGIVADGEQMTAEQMDEAAEDLNLIVKGLEKYRKKLWTIEDITITLDTPSQASYGGKNYGCIFTHTSTATDTPDTSKYWVEIETDDTLAAWASGTAYIGHSFDVPAGTTAIEHATFYESDSPNTTRKLELMNRFDEQEIPDKTQTGVPEQLYFRRYPLPGRAYIYPIPDRECVITYSRIRLPDDITTAGGFPDIPVTLIAYLIYELAAEIAEEYDRDEIKIQRLRNKAQVELALAIRDQKEYSDHEFISPAY